MPKNKTCWIVVADGVRARIFANDGPGTGLRNALEMDFIADNRRSRDIVSDRPGRSVGGAGGPGGRHTMEPKVDSHQYEKRMFARQIAGHVNDACQRGDFDRLVLVAPPQTLGVMRDALGKPALSKVVAELGKDLTRIAVHDLPRHMEGAIRL